MRLKCAEVSPRAIVSESRQKERNFVTPHEANFLLAAFSQLRPGEETRPTRGRPRRNPLDALRARTWYWTLKIASGMTDYQLNGTLLGLKRGDLRGEIPRKAFERIRRKGVLPNDDVHGSLIDRAAALDGCGNTAAVFRSEFWELLRRPNMELAELKQLILRLSLSLGVTRPTHAEAWSGKTQTTIGLTRHYQEGVQLIKNQGGLDSMALLGALYREALQFGEIEVASELKRSFMAALIKYEALLKSAQELPAIFRFAEQLSRDASSLSEMAISRVISGGNAKARLGDHAETLYAFKQMR